MNTQETKTESQQTSQAEVATAAYYLWQQEGSPNGREQEFWLRAESQLREQFGGKGSTLSAAPLPPSTTIKPPLLAATPSAPAVSSSPSATNQGKPVSGSKKSARSRKTT